MTDRVTLTAPIYMKIWGQWMTVLGGSQIDVPSASAFAPSQITNVQLGTGTLLGGVHAQPVANFRQKS
jgi:hypothetical protein